MLRMSEMSYPLPSLDGRRNECYDSSKSQWLHLNGVSKRACMANTMFNKNCNRLPALFKSPKLHILVNQSLLDLIYAHNVP